MKKNYILLMLLLVSCFGWQTNAQSPNDICEDAILVDCGSSSVGDSTDATNTDAPQEVCGTTLNTAPGEWYSITIPNDGFYNVTVDTFGSLFDTKLGVYSGACDALVCVGGNDDTGGLQSEVSFIGTASETYTVYVTGFGTNTGEYTLNVSCEFIPPASIELPITLENQLPTFGDFNGSFTQAIENPDASGENTSSTVAENTVPGGAAFAGVNFGLDTPIDIITNKGFSMSVWSPIANTPVLLKLENATTGVNAERAVTTTTTSAWETVSFDFSTEGDLTFESVTVFMNFNVTDPATQVYYWDNLNQFNLNVGGTTCANALEVTPGVYNDVFIVSDSGGSANVTDDLGPDALWYSYTPIESGTININSCISDPSPVDTRLFVYTDGCDILTLVDNDDDGCDAPNGFGSSIEEINVIGGQEYLIEWDDRWNEVPFDWELIFTPLPACPEPLDVVVTPNAFDAIITWSAVVEATTGYIVNVFEAGSDPTVDTPVYTENIPTGTLTATATGLTPETNYEAYVIADCESEGISLADPNFFTTLVACPAPSNFAVTTTVDTEATFTWDVVAEAVNGYTLSVFDAGADPTLDTAVYTEAVGAGIVTATATGLALDSGYDAYLVSDCDTNGFSQENLLSFTTPFPAPECGGLYLDSGGSAGNYQPNELTVTTITPDVPGEAVTVTFTYVDIEVGGPNGGCWDFLTVYDGPDTTFPVLAQTLCGEESGDGGQAGEPGSILSIGDSFTSSDPSGALTFVFDSDGSVQETGWSADVTCAVPPVGCGDVYYDEGGVDGDYLASEATVTTISPDVAGDAVTVTFTYVDIESSTGTGTQDGCWDYLTVYNGPDTTFPVLAQTLCGEESGDGGVPSDPNSLLSVGDIFTSTDPSGSLTFVFTSDTNLQETGWVADVTCAPIVIPCPEVENFTVENVTETTADLSWDAAEGAIFYDWTVFIAGADIEVDNPVAFENTTATTATAQGLIPGFSYDAYIQTDCGGNNNVSDVVGPITFTTTALGVNDIDVTTFVFAPNPADGNVNIVATTAITALQIVNMLGQNVLSITPNSKEFTIDVSCLSSGAYFINAITNGVTTTKKLIRK
ncbi:T9SS type A sorting domain-containing protein [Flavobacteriaceae bacterium]|nr:T9SS type A sorting domain-containing protein [Flavobacteriaceae bacterium]